MGRMAITARTVRCRGARPATDTDRFEEALALLQATDRAVYGGTDWTEAELREEWEAIDLERDAWLAELDGRLAGVMHLCERRGATFISDGYVHPELRGRGVGSTLLDLAEARALERVGEAPPEARIALHNSHLVGDEAAPTLLAAKGFSPVRTFFRMVADLDGTDLTPAWPEGIDVRPLDVETHGRLLHAADEEAFAEEWGYTPMPYDAWTKRVFDEDAVRPGAVRRRLGRRRDRGLLAQLPEAHGRLGLGRRARRRPCVAAAGSRPRAAAGELPPLPRRR